VVTRVIDGRTHRLALRPEALAKTADGSMISACAGSASSTSSGSTSSNEGCEDDRGGATCASNRADLRRAPIDRVFEAWTSEEVLRRWLHADPNWDTPVAEVDLRVGGTVRIVMRDPETGREWGARGEYTVVEPPHRLAFTWAWDHDQPNPQLIELELSEHEGRTTVVMINSGIPTDEMSSDQEGGWHRCYDNLDGALAHPF
jgi:uncharacterized protein YndB with AHSA1/START domain